MFRYVLTALFVASSLQVGSSFAVQATSSLPCTAVGAAVCAGPTEPCYLDTTCSSSPPRLGGMGCNAGGAGQNCRFCGFGPFETCPTGAAVGDPHMTNIFEEQFDVMADGEHTFIQIPRKAAPDATLLRVDGVVKSAFNCRAHFIKQLNITGKWAEASHKDGLFIDVDAPRSVLLSDHHRTSHKTYNFGPVTLKIDNNFSPKGFGNLDLHVMSLGGVTDRVGGILGEDNHEAATRPSCHHKRHHADYPTLALDTQ